MHRITVSARVNLSHLFWLRSLAIIGQLCTIAFVQLFIGVQLPLPAMLFVIAMEVAFNGVTWLRVTQDRPESNLELFGQLWVDLGALSALLFLSGGTRPSRWSATCCSASTTFRSISTIPPTCSTTIARACG
jgi:two-component system, sensor histidine kinase RegB